MRNIPAKFLEKMEVLLKEEYDNFMSSYEAPRVSGLRINPLKIDVGSWKDISPMKERVRLIPWAEDGLYYSEEDRPGVYPHYNAGLYYIQEPSAMLPVELLDVQPGHRVLDLCAAPGGKSTQIAGKLMGQGVLVSNDNAYERTKPLAKNIELSGVTNAVVLNEEPSAIAQAFHEWFDRILVDAPCSGEGMFRKDESMAASWEKHSVERCSIMQKDILMHAATMLAPGGKIVYSTCTFSPEENETQIAAFLADHPSFEVEAVKPPGGISTGRADWVAPDVAVRLEDKGASLAGTVRLWPHLLEGEGHYAAVLRKRGERAHSSEVREASISDVGNDNGDDSLSMPIKSKKHGKGRHTDKQLRGGKFAGKAAVVEADPQEVWQVFASNELKLDYASLGEIVTYGSIVYLQPHNLPSLNGLKVVRAGWFVGESKKGRFTPSQALALGLTREQAVRSMNWKSSDEEIQRYLKGETLFVDKEQLVLAEDAVAKGYVLVCVDGYPVGWGKYVDGMLKNELSIGWRRM